MYELWSSGKPFLIAVPGDMTCHNQHVPKERVGEDHGMVWVAEQAFHVRSAEKAMEK